MKMHNPPHRGEILRELYLKPLGLTMKAAAEGLGVIPGARMIDSSVLPPVMPAHAGIHDLPSLQQRKSWKPAFAGMTGVAARASMFRAVGITRKALSELVNGHTDMSRDMAIRLAKAFPRTDIRLWLDMQLQYDTWQAEQRASSIKVRPFPSPAPA